MNFLEYLKKAADAPNHTAPQLGFIDCPSLLMTEGARDNMKRIGGENLCRWCEKALDVIGGSDCCPDVSEVYEILKKVAEGKKK